jgi:hypothetical protein
VAFLFESIYNFNETIYDINQILLIYFISFYSQNRKLPYGNDSMWQWSSKSTKLQQSSFAEKLFLASKQSKQFQKLRSFSVNKRGTLIDCGYCYRPLLQQKKGK